jgi:lipoyl(octanoyl) transferase
MAMEWKISPDPIPYEEAVARMEARVRDIRGGQAGELVWLLEHPALYTAGTGASDGDLMDTLGFPVFKTGRGGQYTYHGPGQRVAYVMLDLKKRTPDVRLFVRNLERWIIATLAEFGVKSFTRKGRVGVWVNTTTSSPHRSPHPNPPPMGEGIRCEAKIAAIGVRIRQWVTYHGISINVNPDLSHYRGIVPCGIREYGVTSLAAMGVKVSLQGINEALQQTFAEAF